jgi:hypothetical protein
MVLLHPKEKGKFNPSGHAWTYPWNAEGVRVVSFLDFVAVFQSPLR